MSTTKSFTRRRFLQASSLAVAAPLILPSRIWSAQTRPNDRIALGFIGMGTQNRGLMGGFLGRPDCQVVAVCEVEPDRRAAAQKTVNDRYARDRESGAYKGCAAYVDFRELLARQDIDAVVIATPDHWHALMSIAAADAGKDIYCEKPLCQSIHEARAMVNAVRRNERVFQTGSMQRSSREFRVACELVRNEVVGKIHTVDVNVGGPAKWCDLPEQELPAGTDWNLWLGPAPERGYNEVLCPKGVHSHFPAWRNYREYGGGGVTDWGAHHFDIAQWGLGMDDSGPVEVIPADRPNATQGVKLKYADGTIVNHGGGDGVTFHGPKGRIVVNRGKFEMWLGDEKIAQDTGSLPELAAKHLGDRSIRLYESSNHLGDWINCIRSRKRPICDVEIGARTVTVCSLVNLSYYHNNAHLKWDPVQEKFADGQGDPAWLDVPYRGPWKLA
jgi:predicted dehydrogenase